MSSQDLKVLFQTLDGHQETFVNDLKEIVSIKSTPNREEEAMQLLQWLEERLKKLGARTEICPAEDLTLELLKSSTVTPQKQTGPYLLVATVGKDPRKKTVCVYAHVDVHWPSVLWKGDPFDAVAKETRITACGVCDKALLLCWLHALEAHVKAKQELPVAVKLVVECCETVGSTKLEAFMTARKRTFFKDVQGLCILTGCGPSLNKPCVASGARGLLYFTVEVIGFLQDLHSGYFGGVLYEPLGDLLFLLDMLHDRRGRIIVPGLVDDVATVLPEHEKQFNKVDLDINNLKKYTGVERLLHAESRSRLLTHRWLLPVISVHALCFGSAHHQIPHRAMAKLSVRLAPGQNPITAADKLSAYLKLLMGERSSPNDLKVRVEMAVAPWQEDEAGPQLQAAKRAVKAVQRVDPEVGRLGSTCAAAAIFQQVMERPVAVIPTCRFDDCLHAPCEKMDVRSFKDAHKVAVAYLHEASRLKPVQIF